MSSNQPHLPVPQSDVCAAGETASGDESRKNGQHTVDLPRIEKAVREILFAIGENPDRPSLVETPNRVARMYVELFSGLHSDPSRHLKKVFEERYDELVLVRDISFNSICEHHLLPFMGVAHVGYLPDGKIAGLSKLARVVDEISRRPQVQERMTHQIADLPHHIHDVIVPGVKSDAIAIGAEGHIPVRCPDAFGIHGATGAIDGAQILGAA